MKKFAVTVMVPRVEIIEAIDVLDAGKKAKRMAPGKSAIPRQAVPFVFSIEEVVEEEIRYPEYDPAA